MKDNRFASIRAIVCFLGLSLISCQPRIPKDALSLAPESLKDRQLQTRIFDTNDEEMLLTASAAVLQDSGYTIEESEVPLGVIVASRERDVSESLEKAGYWCATCLCLNPVGYPKRQKVFASLVTKPLVDKRIAVRITFQHMVWTNEGLLYKNEQLNDPIVYQKFFSKLSKSVFLIGHEI